MFVVRFCVPRFRSLCPEIAVDGAEERTTTDKYAEQTNDDDGGVSDDEEGEGSQPTRGTRLPRCRCVLV